MDVYLNDVPSAVPSTGALFYNQREHLNTSHTYCHTRRDLPRTWWDLSSSSLGPTSRVDTR